MKFCNSVTNFLLGILHYLSLIFCFSFIIFVLSFFFGKHKDLSRIIKLKFILTDHILYVIETTQYFTTVPQQQQQQQQFHQPHFQQPTKKPPIKITDPTSGEDVTNAILNISQSNSRKKVFSNGCNANSRADSSEVARSNAAFSAKFSALKKNEGKNK